MTRPLRHFVTPPPNPSDLGEEGRGASGSHEPETADGSMTLPRLGRAGGRRLSFLNQGNN